MIAIVIMGIETGGKDSQETWETIMKFYQKTPDKLNLTKYTKIISQKIYSIEMFVREDSFKDKRSARKNIWINLPWFMNYWEAFLDTFPNKNLLKHCFNQFF